MLLFVRISGTHGTEALLVTIDDEVYALGINAHGCLGLGNHQGTLFPQCVEQLCGKGIQSKFDLYACNIFYSNCCSSKLPVLFPGFAYGSGPHVLALTERGEVYSWGQNVYCELGHGASTPGLLPTMIGGFLSTLKVVEVACGSHHSIALTDCGQVGIHINGCALIIPSVSLNFYHTLFQNFYSRCLAGVKTTVAKLGQVQLAISALQSESPIRYHHARLLAWHVVKLAPMLYWRMGRYAIIKVKTCKKLTIAAFFLKKKLF